MQYAKSGDVNIAYQVSGEGPFDLVFVPGYVTHLELHWAIPSFAPFLWRLSSFSRLIRFDKRGTGMSDRVSGAPMLETRMDDVRAVMDAVGSRRQRSTVCPKAAAMSLLFAATIPNEWLRRRAERVSAQDVGARLPVGANRGGSSEREVERDLRVFGPRQQARALIASGSSRTTRRSLFCRCCASRQARGSLEALSPNEQGDRCPPGSPAVRVRL